MRVLGILSIIIGTISWVLAKPPIDSKKWIKAQYAAVPANYRLSIPSTNFPITTTDAHFLATATNPVVRNVYINQTYHNIGEKLSQCMGVKGKVGNWFHFATWASVSAGEVISGKKFGELNAFESVGNWFMGSCGMAMTEKEQKDLFGKVNAQIATEMIPLGRAFLAEFCTPGKKGDWNAFQKKMLQGPLPEDKMLRDAFKLYVEAIDEKNYDTKVEKITMASTLQVYSEQTRVDPVLDKVFTFSTPGGVGAGFMRSYCTDMGCYIMKNNGSVTSMTLSQEVTAILTPIELQTIELPSLRQLYKDHDVKFKNCPTPFQGSGCTDWSDLGQRQTYLGALFRGHITNTDLLGVPHPWLGRQIGGYRGFEAAGTSMSDIMINQYIIKRHLKAVQ